MPKIKTEPEPEVDEENNAMLPYDYDSASDHDDEISDVKEEVNENNDKIAESPVQVPKLKNVKIEPPRVTIEISKNENNDNIAESPVQVPKLKNVKIEPLKVTMENDDNNNDADSNDQQHFGRDLAEEEKEFKDGFKKILKKKTTIPRSYSEDVGSHDTHADQYVKETIEDEPLTANIPAHLLPSSIEDPKHVVFGGEDKGKICFVTHIFVLKLGISPRIY